MREFPVVAVGAPVPGATLAIPCPGTDDPYIGLLVETGVAELAAAEL